MGRAFHDGEANLHYSDHADPDTTGYLTETASEFGLMSKEAALRKNNRNKASFISYQLPFEPVMVYESPLAARSTIEADVDASLLRFVPPYMI